MEGKEEKWREKLEQFKQDDRYDYLIELLLPYTAGLRAGSLDRGFLPILCEVEELLDKAREEGFRNCYKEVLAMDSFGEKMDMSRKESFRRLKNLLEDKIRLKLTTK